MSEHGHPPLDKRFVLPGHRKMLLLPAWKFSVRKACYVLLFPTRTVRLTRPLLVVLLTATLFVSPSPTFDLPRQADHAEARLWIFDEWT